MTTNDQDLRALTYLARRLRDETHGCAQWDEAGTFACLKDALAGQNLLIACQRVLGHATDPTAKTPGAIKRPFVPEPTNQPARVPYDPRAVCHDCGHRRDEHRAADHEFRSVESVRAVPSTKAPQAIRDAIHAPDPRPAQRSFTEATATPTQADDNRAAAAREGLRAGAGEES